MKRGFMEHAATILVPEFPGETALWYAKAFLNEAGEDGSDSKTKEQSLANTLNKQVKEERETRIWRKKLNDGKYHYFPVSISPASDSIEENIVQLSLLPKELQDIDNLVTVDKFKTRSNALRWLVMEGIKANHDYLKKVADTVNQIERLKKELVV
jgi:hypothetical protein